MADAPALTIRRDWPRPSEAERAAFRDAPTGWVVDAQGRRGALDHRIRPVTRATRILGAALPVWSRGGDNLAPYAALRFARPGDVLMVATEAFETASVAGDILVGMARNAGIVGCITDGVVRDIPGLDAVGIPVFARGVTPNSPQKDGPGTIGLPIVLGGVTVAPGDLIVADGDGVVVTDLAPGSSDSGYGVVLQPDGGIVVGGNAIVSFDPQQETFTVYELPSPNASVRQLLGRPGEETLPLARQLLPFLGGERGGAGVQGAFPGGAAAVAPRVLPPGAPSRVRLGLTASPVPSPGFALAVVEVVVHGLAVGVVVQAGIDLLRAHVVEEVEHQGVGRRFQAVR